MNFTKHPLQILLKLSKNLPIDTEFEFSIYEYEPQSILDTRKTFRLPSTEMTKEKIEEIINSLGEFEELALNSKVRASRKVHHIPMIDFFTDIETLNKNKQTLKNILPSKIYKNLEIYSSGNSLHGYSLTLISPKEWLDYMGRLLLTNLPNKPQLVDTRWIGHRLRAGYTSLRWSNNSKNYLASPTLIGHLDLLN